MLPVPLTTSSLIWSPEKYSVSSTHHEVPHYAAASSLLLLPPLGPCIFISNLSLNTLNLCYSFKLRNLSHPQTTQAREKLSLSTPWWHMGGLEVQLHSFLTLALVKWSTSRPDYFTPVKGLWYQLNMRLPGLKAVIKFQRREKSLIPAGIWMLDHPKLIAQSLFQLRYPSSTLI
jgi:hypothetical protein